MFRLPGVAALALLAATPLAAQAGFDNDKVLEEFSTENVKPALRAAGATTLVDQVSSSGTAYVRAEFDNNRVVVVTPRACPPQGTQCRGLSLRAFWRPQGKTEGELHAAIDKFNDSAVAIGSLLNGDTVFISYYLIGDYGTPQGNLRVSTEVFLRDLDTLREATQ